jgi:hypothetical protein
MQPITNPHASVTSRAALCIALLFALLLVAERPSGATQENGLSQALVTYSFLASHYSLNFLFVPEHATDTLVRDMKALNEALSALHCDTPNVLATTSHTAVIVPTSAVGQWFGLEPTKTTPHDGLLFVTEPETGNGKKVLVVVSGIRPDETTIFWLEDAKGTFSTTLLYDSFKKGKVVNSPDTPVGMVMAVRLEKDEDILLKEWAEPGSRPGIMGEVGRVFRLDPLRDTVTLVSAGKPPQ